ncbi:MAG: hypothetical protein R3326_02460 [Gemmatimonadota bacterium]|nr:hypothetical protein [Gemmatimonadota bacterium]
MVRRILWIAALFLLTGCWGREVDTRPVAGLWSADVRAVGEHGHSGFATGSILVSGATRMNVTLSGGSAGGVHPWAVQAGLCGSEGPVVGREQDYPVLRPNERGNASATATLDVRLDPSADYHVVIHQSDEDHTIVGCGQLIATDGASGS